VLASGSPPRGAGGGDPVKERLEKWLGTAETLGFKLSEDQVDALRCLATATAWWPNNHIL
jgi:hypothetical protein